MAVLMTTLDDLFPPADLKAEIDAGYVTRKRHPELPLSIYVYGRTCQYENHWTPVTTRCRGLVADDTDGRIIAYCLPKFFNYSQHGVGYDFAPPLPDEPFEVYDKVDGCFPTSTALNLWGGGTITIGEVVRKKLPVTLVGMDEHGNLVPSPVTGWHRNGRKDLWLDITVDSHVSRTSGAGGHPNRLRVTPNHQIFVNGKYAPAIEVRPGDEIVTQSWCPSRSVLHLIRASLLGDGCVTPGAQKPSLKAKYQEPHAMNQLGYVEALRKALGDCGAVRSETVSGYGSELTWAGSREYEALADLRREWYPNGVRCLPQDLSWIDDFAIAKWYMDDGSRSHSGTQRDRMLFATNRFPEADVRRLADLLVARYGVRCSVYYSRGWCLRVNAGRDQSIDRMWAAIAPHVHPSVRYKLPTEWRDVPYTEMEPGVEVPVPKVAHVVSVEPVAPTKANFPSGRIGYDITTATHNYMARGVLVHNSLGIVFHYDNAWRAASKGSFISDQAEWAQRYLDQVDTSALDTSVTYLAEIIYPENRIVVNYGDRRDLVLLAAFRADGGELPLREAAPAWRGVGSVVRTYDWSDAFGVLAAMAEKNQHLDGTDATGTDAEGWVIRFASGVRVKTKIAEYVRLHKSLTGTNARDVWQYLGAQKFGFYPAKRLGQTLGCSAEEATQLAGVYSGALSKLLENVPDEFDAWVRSVCADLENAAAELSARIEDEFKNLAHLREDRAAFARAAQLVQDRTVRAALFLMLDGKALDLHVWRAIRPEPSDPFAVDEEG